MRTVKDQDTYRPPKVLVKVPMVVIKILSFNSRLLIFEAPVLSIRIRQQAGNGEQRQGFFIIFGRMFIAEFP